MIMKIAITTLLSAVVAGSLFFFSNNTAMSEDKTPAKAPVVAPEHQQITLGAGCFWCTEAVYNRLDGVISSTSGYMGGTRANPTYNDVISNNTGEVEVVTVVYDPKKISTEKILEWFWALHDPTQVDGQGADIGPQYLSAIFCHTDEQKKVAEKSKTSAQKDHKKPIATSIKKATKFHPAEVYHQDYYRLNKNQNPYCRLVITPKMEKLKLENKKDVGE